MKLIGLRRWWRRNKAGILSRASVPLVRALVASLRLGRGAAPSVAGDAGGTILCAWHGKSFLVLKAYRNRGYWGLFSLSRDGETLSRIYAGFGFRPIRGSSGGGGPRAAIEAIRLLRLGETVVVTPDGPKGPVRVVQGGAVLMARKSGAKLIPVGISSRWRLLANSWDRYLVPLPFSRIVVLHGDPIEIPAGADEAAIEDVRARLERALRELDDQADRLAGSKPVSEIAVPLPRRDKAAASGTRRSIPGAAHVPPSTAHGGQDVGGKG